VKETCWSSQGVQAVFNSNDAQLESRVLQLLRGQHFKTVQELDVSVVNRVATVWGTVDSFYEKQIAVSVCRQVQGLRRLNDKIDVDYVRTQRMLSSGSIVGRPR
jgi:osmotically-inducible protein OsmY